MDNQRLMTWGVFVILAWMTYQAWMMDYARPPAPAVVADPASELVVLDDSVELPVLADDMTGSPASADELPTVSTDQAETATASTPTITVRTDVFELQISTAGGTLQQASLLKYPVAKDQPDTLIELLSPTRENLGLVQSGLRAADGAPEANHLTTFVTDQDRYQLRDGVDELVVPLTWADGSGVRVEKTFRFKRGSYAIDLQQKVFNGSSDDWRGASYTRLQRSNKPPERSMFDVDTYSFAGPVIYNGEKAEKLNRDDLIEDGTVTFTASNGWIAAIQHHFLSAVVPPSDTQQRVSVAVKGGVSTATIIGSAKIVAPGTDATFNDQIFVGPKLQAQLEKITPSLKLTVDYGWLTIISQPLFWLLSKVHKLVGNWGLSIILVTVLIKLAFYKLTQASGRSMAKMRNLQPRMKALQDRYKDDRPALSAAMMELYKKEKVNPAAGCLPILIQMPFFLAFYWVLLESVEMRQAPFALWITDLSVRDPFFVLPIIMGAAMLFQQKLNPAPTDPVQAKVMSIMPIMFTGMFAFFPSGLVLYWVTNTLLSIAQQWRINQVVELEDKKKKA